MRGKRINKDNELSKFNPFKFIINHNFLTNNKRKEIFKKYWFYK